MSERIRVAVTGALGKMGREVVRSIVADPDFELVITVDRHAHEIALREAMGDKMPDIPVESRLGVALDRVPTDVLIDFTHHSAAAGHALSALKRGVSPVIGTTGLRHEELAELIAESKERGVSGIYAPNFAVGAVLMMRFSALAAKWLPDAEIIEFHHDQKVDAPSGTAMLTAEMIGDARHKSPKELVEPTIKAAGARGGLVHKVPVHSVRLPGHVAHQSVIFGGQGETLTIRHDSIDRSSFMDGVKLCARRVKTLPGFVIGMDKILFGEV
jgi:4-hydroxy-tetrahydrodipicolinate reductase